MGHDFNRSLQLILMPTEQCNFRCTYCFEDFALGRMKPDVVAGIKRLLERRAPELDRLAIAWFGGEPLLAADVVEEVQQWVRHLARRYAPLRLRGSMTTNGYLLRPTLFSRLVELGVRHYQIAFDGLRETHDRKRVRIGGQGSFDRIWSNLEAARESAGSYEITVRLQIDRESLGSVGAFTRLFERSFGDDSRFRLAKAPLVDCQRSGDGSFLRDAELASVLEESRAALDRPGPYVCYAARPDSLLVRSNGELGKCTVALSSPENRVGRINPDGTVEMDPAKMQLWMRGLWSRDERELACPKAGYADSGGALVRCAERAG
jgi:uncharacterized protein